LANEALAAAELVSATPLRRLAKFFSYAVPLHLAVRVVRPDRGSEEKAVIEFGTAREVLFTSSQPIEFAEKVRVRNADGTLDAEASIVAVQCQQEGVAVAARFTQEIPNWIVKP
jgi:hypothetical protein